MIQKTKGTNWRTSMSISPSSDSLPNFDSVFPDQRPASPKGTAHFTGIEAINDLAADIENFSMDACQGSPRTGSVVSFNFSSTDAADSVKGKYESAPPLTEDQLAVVKRIKELIKPTFFQEEPSV